MNQYFFDFLDLPSCRAYLHWDWMCWLVHQRYFALDGLVDVNEPGAFNQW